METSPEKNKINYGYYAMGALVLIALFNIWHGNIATAALNIAIGVALGGSQTKSWDEIGGGMRVLYILLLLISVTLFGYVVFQDFTR